MTAIRPLATAFAALLLGAGLASAETWRFAHKMPADSPEGKVFQFFADRARELSNGDMDVQVFPAEQLGKEAAILEQLELGTVNLYAEDAFFLQKWVPDIKWVAPPFMFQTREEWVRYTESDLVKGWLKEAEDIAGVRPLGEPMAVVRGPYRTLLSKKPIKSFEDIKGIKLRMYPDQLAIEVWSQLGADLAMLSWSETYQGLQSGLANSVTSPAALIVATGLYEQAPHITQTNEFWQGLPFMMNAAAFDGLSPENQQALLQAHADTAEYSKQLITESADAMRAAVEAKGATFSNMPLEPLFAYMGDWYAKKDAAGQLPEGLLTAAAAAKGQ